MIPNGRLRGGAHRARTFWRTCNPANHRSHVCAIFCAGVFWVAVVAVAAAAESPAKPAPGQEVTGGQPIDWSVVLVDSATVLCVVVLCATGYAAMRAHEMHTVPTRPDPIASVPLVTQRRTGDGAHRTVPSAPALPTERLSDDGYPARDGLCEALSRAADGEDTEGDTGSRTPAAAAAAAPTPTPAHLPM